MPTRVGIAFRPRDDMRHTSELVITAGASVRRVGAPDVAHDEAVLMSVDAGHPAYLLVVTAEGGEGIRLPPPPPAHFRA